MRRIRNHIESEKLIAPYLAKAVESSGEIVFVTDHEGIFRYVNPEFSRVYGYMPEEVVGVQTPRLLQSGKMGKEFYVRLWETVKAGDIFRGDVINKTKDGSLRTIEVSINPFMHGSKEFNGFLAIQKDVTEVRARQAELIKSEERFRMLVNSLDDIVFTLDDQGRHTGIYGTWAKRDGLPPEFFLGKTSVDIFGSEKGSLHLQKAIAALGGTVQRYEWEADSDVGKRYFETVLSPLYAGNGTPHGVVGLGRDVTAMRAVVREQNRSSRKYQELYESTPVALVSVATDGRILRFNRRAIELFKIPLAEALGAPISRYFSKNPEQRKTAERLMAAFLSGQSARNVVVEAFTSTVGSVWLDVSFTPIFEDDRLVEGQLAIIDVTEKRRVQRAMEEIAESKTRLSSELHLILNTVSEGIYGVDRDGVCTFINRAGLDVLGYEQTELIGKRINEVIGMVPRPPIGSSRDGSADGSSGPGLRSDGLLTSEVKRKDGRIVTVELNINVLEVQGSLMGSVVSFRDVSRRLRDQRKMEEAVEQYRGLMDAGNDAIVIADVTSGMIVEMNRKAESLLGVRHLDLVGKQFHGLFNETREASDARTPKGVLHSIFSPGLLTETEIIDSGGNRIPVEVSITMVDVHGMTILQAVFRDIRDRRKMQEELLRRTLFFEQLFESSPTAIAMLDRRQCIRKINRSFISIFGYTEEECVGKQLNELIVPPERTRESEELNEQLILGEDLQHESVRQSKDGSAIEVLMMGFPIVIDGQHQGSYVMYSDLREQKKIESKFLRAQRLESIGILAGGVAHDLNNVLGPILLSIDLLKQIAVDPASKKVLASIDASARRGSGIVKQILSFARGDEGERVPVSIKHAIYELREMIQQSVPSSISVRTSVAKGLWYVKGEMTHVHQVLLNLCVNARDAMPEGGILTVGAENVTIDDAFSSMRGAMPAGRYVLISVTDTGTGIPKELQTRIFDPFFTTKDRGKGTGLGLSTVMGIVRSYSGFIDLVSEAGKGTTFKVYLPAIEFGVELPDAAVEADIPGNGETILVIDDEESLLSILSQSLTQRGYRVLEARNGAEGVALAAKSQESIQLAIVDVVMPYMDGPTTVRSLRVLLPAIPMIAISGMEFDRSKFTDGGEVQVFLPKPFTMSVLAREIQSLLGARTPDGARDAVEAPFRPRRPDDLSVI